MKFLGFLWDNMHIVLMAMCFIFVRDVSQPDVSQAVAWLVPAIIAAVSAAAQGIGAAVGNSKKKKALRALDRSYGERIEETEAEMNSNFLDRADSQDALRKITNSNEEALRQLNTEAIRGGATDEAKVAMASNLTKRTADAVGELSALGAQYKDKLRAHRDNLKAERAAQTFAADSDVSGIDAIVQGIGQVANAFGTAYAAKGSTPQAGTPLSSSEIQAGVDSRMSNYIDQTQDNVIKYGRRIW